MPLPTSHLFIVPSGPTSGHRTLELDGLIHGEHAGSVAGRGLVRAATGEMVKGQHRLGDDDGERRTESLEP